MVAPIEPSPSFYFSSTGRELHATGVREIITTPAVGAEAADSALQQAVADGFERARKAGQDNPIVVGAIPFSTTAPSCLYIPQHSQWRQKTAMAVPVPGPSPALVSRTTTPDADGLKAAVKHAVGAFERGELHKAVLAATQELHFATALDAHEIFRRLQAQNCNAYQFFVPLTDGGTWIGASPELLICKQGDHIVSNPLAGSARRLEDPEADRATAEQLVSSSKNQHEHALVIQKIAKKLAPICSQLQVPEHPSLTQAEALWHLSTRIEGRLHDPSLNALQLACLLHPTPAVCGFPTAPARQLIAELEPFERRFFSGMVGWCDADGNGEWAVAIRCGEIHRTHARLFAGAGIVAKSQPEAEWAEIQTKFGIMLRALGVNG